MDAKDIITQSLRKHGRIVFVGSAHDAATTVTLTPLSAADSIGGRNTLTQVRLA